MNQRKEFFHLCLSELMRAIYRTALVLVLLLVTDIIPPRAKLAAYQAESRSIWTISGSRNEKMWLAISRN